MDDAIQALAIDHYNQDPFLDSEYTTKELHFAIKGLRVQLSRERDRIYYIIISNFQNEAFKIPLEIYIIILRARVFPDDCKKYRLSLSIKTTKPI
jgi:hypothetical protein